MISTVCCSSGVQYIVWSKESVHGSLEVSISNGKEAYEVVLSVCSNKPPSFADGEKWWRDMLLSIQEPDAGKHEFSIVMRTNSTSTSCDMTVYVKESIKTKILLVKCTLSAVIANSAGAAPAGAEAPSATMTMFRLAGRELKAQRELVLTLKRESDVVALQNRALEADMVALRRDKDAWQDGVYRKMCLLINSKKREIARLESLIKLDSTKTELLGTYTLAQSETLAQSQANMATETRGRKRRVVCEESDRASHSDSELEWGEGEDETTEATLTKPVAKRQKVTKPAKKAAPAARARRSRQLIENVPLPSAPSSASARTINSKTAEATCSGTGGDDGGNSSESDDLEAMYRAVAGSASSLHSTISAPSSFSTDIRNQSLGSASASASEPSVAGKTGSLLSTMMGGDSSEEEHATQIIESSQVESKNEYPFCDSDPNPRRSISVWCPQPPMSSLIRPITSSSRL